MSDLEQRVKVLETKVQILEETLETLKKMQLSEQMDEYIKSKSKSLKLVKLLNSVSDKQKLDFTKEEESVQRIGTTKKSIDQQIAAALIDSGDFSEQCPDDLRFFSYEIESGMEKNRIKREDNEKILLKYIGRGIRITSYNGFETERIIVPKEIDGQPVISIGEKAFKNASFSELILPSSVKVILKNAFEGCMNLKQIDLPVELEYLGEECFLNAGLESLEIPNSVEIIPYGCFMGCKNLNRIVLGNRTKVLSMNAFHGCIKLNRISLPETVNTISNWCFSKTAIRTLIIPSGVSEIESECFGSRRDIRNNNVTCVFLGKETMMGKNCKPLYVDLIYCLPSSNVQKFAREYSIPMKPLSEFDLENI